MNIHCLTVANDEIRIRKGFSGADWWLREEVGEVIVEVRVAKMSCREYEVCLAVHEIVESCLWWFRNGCDVSKVDIFDADFEKQHPENHGIEAGDADSPYGVEHTVATCCERAVFAFLKLIRPEMGSWSDYDMELGAL